ncbi:MAG: apolipoprotein N-acyltransferase [Hyphomicrobium sp.]|nr:apolipoprotein N-acyltransferase [Hyphomicrobium sp.]PPD07426.1 MAG: apolipoprotein N-acyltransferase [Hyphomicrobium sp.]
MTALARVQDVRGGLRAATGWRRVAVLTLAGMASVLAFAPVFLWSILFLTLPILAWAITQPTPEAASRDGIERAFKDGWWFGFGYFFAGLFWVGEAFLVEADVFGWLLPFAVTLLPAGLALFLGAAAAVTRALWRPGLAGILVMAIVFTAAEWLRGHILTGFPWNTIGYALTATDVQMQTAGLIGIYGLTLWAFVIFPSPLVLATEAPKATSSLAAFAPGLALAIVPLALSALYGAYVLSNAPSPDANAPRVRIVQPSVPQREKWLPEKQGEIFRLHLDLTARNAAGESDGMDGIALVVWPEAAMPFRPLEHPEALTAIADLLPDDGPVLLSGGLRVERDGTEAAPTLRAFNSLLAFDGAGKPITIYDKIHLVPFGEYLPFQPALEAIGLQQLTRLRGGFASGPSPRPLLRLPGLPPITGLICYEAIFPGAVVQAAERPGLIVNITNDGWFGNTTGPPQHLHQSRVRAVEEGVPLIRAANNGISAMIDANGRLQATLGLNARGVIDQPIPPAVDAPIYARWGEWALVLNIVFFSLLIAWFRHVKSGRKTSK